MLNIKRGHDLMYRQLIQGLYPLHGGVGQDNTEVAVVR